MKLMAWTLTAIFLVVFFHEQAEAGRIGYQITREGRSVPTWKAYYLYPGEYHIRMLVGEDNLGCGLRVGTKSSNTDLLKLSGPLSVRNITNPLSFFNGLVESIFTPLDTRNWKFRFYCDASGKITVAEPPSLAVPVMMTLTYGPFLKQTLPALVTQKVAVQSFSASPARRTYSVGQQVAMNVNFSRKKLDREDSPNVRWRIPQGKLCVPSEGSRNPISFGPITKWQQSLRFGEEGPLYFDHKSLDSVILCESGQTVVEVSLEEHPMTDPTIKRLVFNVGKRKAPTRRTNQIRSRGIESLPPLVIPDPEPPALPNFELQNEKP